jgi:hypothetical protein
MATLLILGAGAVVVVLMVIGRRERERTHASPQSSQLGDSTGGDAGVHTPVPHDTGCDDSSSASDAGCDGGDGGGGGGE